VEDGRWDDDDVVVDDCGWDSLPLLLFEFGSFDCDEEDDDPDATSSSVGGSYSTSPPVNKMR